MTVVLLFTKLVKIDTHTKRVVFDKPEIVDYNIDMIINLFHNCENSHISDLLVKEAIESRTTCYELYLLIDQIFMKQDFENEREEKLNYDATLKRITSRQHISVLTEMKKKSFQLYLQNKNLLDDPLRKIIFTMMIRFFEMQHLGHHDPAPFLEKKK